MTETDFRIYIDETLYFCAGSFFMPIGGGRPVGFLHESFSSTVRLAVRNLFFIYLDH